MSIFRGCGSVWRISMLIALVAFAGVPAWAATIRVSSTTGIMDADGVTPLQGTGLGSPSSDKVQLLYAGPNGVIQPPSLTGQSTGDDELIETSEYPGQYHTAIGEGFPFNPNQGKFTEDFVHSLSAGAKIYVRAWNSPTIGAGAKYGESPLYSLTNTLGETHNFGTWLTNKEVQQLPWSGVGGISLLGAALAVLVVWRLRARRGVMKLQ